MCNLFENYQSSMLESIKNANDNLNDITPLKLNVGSFEIFLPCSFGFCFGVRNAMKIVSSAIKDNQNKNKYLLSEIIHNENVNSDLLKQGVKFIFDKKGMVQIPFDTLKKDDVCIIPAFGATREVLNILNSKIDKNNIYDTCCPFVKKVWEASKKIGECGASLIIHGKFNHEEAKATFSYAKQFTDVIVIKDENEAMFLADCIRRKKTREEFHEKFKDVITKDFDYDKHLKKIGIVNQTTMLAQDTLKIFELIKEALNDVGGEFIDTKSTLCYATSKNQASVKRLMQEKLDAVFVVGGFNSSNTTNLYKIAKEFCKNTYFIKDASCLISKNEVLVYDVDKKTQISVFDYLKNVKKIGIIAGASCPDIVIENVIKKFG